MKRKSTALIAVLVHLVFALPQAEIRETSDGYSITVTTPEIERSIVAIDDIALDGTPVSEQFEQIRIEGYTIAPATGSPGMPMGALDIAYEGAVPTFSITNIEMDTIALNHRILPVQPLPSYSLPQPLKFEIDEASYARSRSGSDLVKVGDIYNIRDQKGVQFLVSPVHYLPESGQIVVVRSFTLNLSLDKPSRIRSNNSSSFDKLIRGSFDNLQSSASRSLPSDLQRSKEKYLIISADRYADNADLQRFVEFRSQTHDVELVSLTDIGGSSKSALHSKIDATDPAYLLFVGEYKDFPSYDGADMAQMTQGQMQGIVKTYLKYIDGGDNRPDIALGLFFVRDAQSLKNIVDKTINNQTNLDAMGDGYLCFAGHNRYGQAPMTATHIDEIFTDFEREYWQPMGFDLTKVYAAGYPNQSDCRKVVSTLNEGLRFLNYNGHGLEMGWNFTQSPSNEIWGEGYFSMNGQTYNLESYGAINNTVNPFVISCACLTGQFKNSGPSWAETWIGHQNLATAFIGASEISFGNQHAMNAYLMEAIKDHDITTFGDMFAFAITNSFNTSKFSNFMASSYAEIGAQEYHFFGDPAVETMELDMIDPFITVTSPNGGDTLAIGESVEITWNSNCQESVSITLHGETEQVIATNTENDGSLIWVVPDSLEDGEYLIEISCGTMSDSSDETFVLKKIPVSENLVAHGDWYVVSDKFEAENASNATLDTTVDSAICGVLSLGQSNETKEIWPWASLVCEPGNDFAGVTGIKLIYKSNNPVTVTLNDSTLNESGAQFGVKLPATSGFSEVMLTCSQFKQPDWTETKDKKELELAIVSSLSFTPDESYGKETEVVVKEFKLFNFKGKSDATAIHELTNAIKPFSVMSVQAERVQLSVPTAGLYEITLHSMKGQILFSQKTQLAAGAHSIDLGLSRLSSQISILSVKGAAGVLRSKLMIQ